MPGRRGSGANKALQKPKVCISSSMQDSLPNLFLQLFLIISIAIKRGNDFLLPFSLRPIHDLAVDPKPVGHARSIDALQVVQHIESSNCLKSAKEKPFETALSKTLSSRR
jgi:hypothetical protein